jgi:hypothetical protein
VGRVIGVAAMDDAARSNLRRLVALSATSRGRSNDARRRGMGAVPLALCGGPDVIYRTCQFPTWTTPHPPRPALFCGAPTRDGEPWCEACRAIVFEGATDG